MEGGANTRYEIVRKIARGGMGEVFLARQMGFGGFSKDVVLKQIHDTFADDPEFVTMFLEEARIAALLDHPNIVQIYGLGQQGKSHFIVMEYVPGLSVSRMLKRVGGPVPLHVGVQIVAEIAGGLQYAHDMTDGEGDPLGLVHRDVSPPNILVSTAGSVKITDFGIAKVKWSTTKTRAGVVKGKYSYLAPEQVKGDVADRQSDLYSLGLNLYELTTGQRAYCKGEQIEVLRNVAKGDFPPPETLVPDYPADLHRVLMKALATRRRERYDHCGEFQEDLLALLVAWGVKMTPAKLGHYLQLAMDDPDQAARMADELGTPGVERGGDQPDPEPLPEPELAGEATHVVEMATVNLTAGSLMEVTSAGGELPDGDGAPLQQYSTMIEPDIVPAQPGLESMTTALESGPQQPLSVSGEIPPMQPAPAMVSGEIGAAPMGSGQHQPVYAPEELAPGGAVAPAPYPAEAYRPNITGPMPAVEPAFDEADASPEAVRAAWSGVHEPAAVTGAPMFRLVLVVLLALAAAGVVGTVIMFSSGDESTGEAVNARQTPGVETGAPVAVASATNNPPAAAATPAPSPASEPVGAAALEAAAEPSPDAGQAAATDLGAASTPDSTSSPDAAPQAVEPAAAPPVAAQPQRRPPAHARLPRVKLSVNTDPTVKVYLGNRLLGKTPLTARIPKRKTVLVLRNRRLGLHTTRKINPQGSRISTHFVLRKGKLGFRFKTPRHVHVDGKFRGTTPRPPLALYEGWHRVVVTDRKKRRRKRERVRVKPGEVTWLQ